MRTLILLLLLFTPASAGCLDDAFAEPGDHVLGVKLPGEFQVHADPAGGWRFGVLQGASFDWMAEVYCSAYLYSADASGRAELPDEDGYRTASFQVPAEVSTIRNCDVFSPGSLGDYARIELGAAGTVLQAKPMQIPRADLIYRLASGTPWTAADALGSLECGQYDRDTGALLAEVPCSNGLGEVLVPIAVRDGIGAL